MPKSRTFFVCNECGAESSQYYGRCTVCNSWNSLVEQVAPQKETKIARLSTASRSRDSSAKTAASKPRLAMTLSQIEDHPQMRLPSGYTELDRVLGGGIVPGSLVLLGGDPGIGKSTLLLQVAHKLSTQQRVLYVCAEESGQQVKLRSQRLAHPQLEGQAVSAATVTGRKGQAKASSERSSESTMTPLPQQLFLLPETDLETVLMELESLQPKVAIIDSIQALYYGALTSAPGSVSQVRECTSALMQLAKRADISLFIVGHVTKEGAIAGPKVLEHLVDTVLYFEGDRFASHRLLRSVKNRFGATHELGVFEMVDRGLEQISNPSALFLSNRDEQVPGIATIVACEGTRPLLVELQALVSPTSYSSRLAALPRGLNSTDCCKFWRCLKSGWVFLCQSWMLTWRHPVDLAVAEPAADLGMAIAIAASFRDRLVDPELVLIGEVGLGGQVRPISQLELRLKEASKLGFKRAIVPKGQTVKVDGLEVTAVSRVVDAIAQALKSS
jgi:DNA repair protein RadA/Sms